MRRIFHSLWRAIRSPVTYLEQCAAERRQHQLRLVRAQSEALGEALRASQDTMLDAVKELAESQRQVLGIAEKWLGLVAPAGAQGARVIALTDENLARQEATEAAAALGIPLGELFGADGPSWLYDDK